MIRIGEPSNYELYYVADGEEAIKIHQAGLPPEWKDYEGNLYFKREKVRKILNKIKIVINLTILYIINDRRE